MSESEHRHAQLIDLVLEARNLVSRPDNEFTYSSWIDTDHALLEVDGILRALTTGSRTPNAALSMILLPTGPMQELATDSGWGDEFVDLANRIDEALARPGD